MRCSHRQRGLCFLIIILLSLMLTQLQSIVAWELLHAHKRRGILWFIRSEAHRTLLLVLKIYLTQRGPPKNRRTIMTAGLAIRALATNNRRRSVARAKLTAIYAAPLSAQGLETGRSVMCCCQPHSKVVPRAGVAACC